MSCKKKQICFRFKIMALYQMAHTQCTMKFGDHWIETTYIMSGFTRNVYECFYMLNSTLYLNTPQIILLNNIAWWYVSLINNSDVAFEWNVSTRDQLHTSSQSCGSFEDIYMSKVKSWKGNHWNVSTKDWLQKFLKL